MNCEYGLDYCRINGCQLLKELESQAQTGGESLGFVSGSGPYWRRETWNDYMSRLKAAACGEGTYLNSEIERITGEKESRGEFH